MSWDGIRDALATRLNAISGLGPVHTYERLITGTPGKSTVQTAFFESSVLNFAWIDRASFRDEHVDGEDTRRRRLHEARIYVVLGHLDTTPTGETFQDRLETIANDLATGSRTLAGACITYSLPVVTGISFTYFGKNLLAHIAEIQFTVEEVLT